MCKKPSVGLFVILSDEDGNTMTCTKKAPKLPRGISFNCGTVFDDASGETFDIGQVRIHSSGDVSIILKTEQVDNLEASGLSMRIAGWIVSEPKSDFIDLD